MDTEGNIYFEKGLIDLLYSNIFSAQKSSYAGTFLSFSMADLQIRLTDWVVR